MLKESVHLLPAIQTRSLHEMSQRRGGMHYGRDSIGLLVYAFRLFQNLIALHAKAFSLSNNLSTLGLDLVLRFH